MIRGLIFLPILFLLSCGDYDDSSLTLNNLPPSIVLYQTTVVIVATKKFRDAQGRMQTDNAYANFYLTSSDSTKARILNDREVYGSGTGQALITAKDNASTLMSAAKTINVN